MVRRVRRSTRENPAQGDGTEEQSSPALWGLLDMIPNVPPTSLQDFTICMYGTKGIGKTTLCASKKGSYTFMFEPLRKNLPILQKSLMVRSVDEIKLKPELDAWKQFKYYLEQIYGNDKITSINVDTIDRAYNACLNSHCADENVRHPGGLKDFGALWGQIKDDFEGTMNSIREHDKGLTLISHVKETNIEVMTGGKEAQFGPSCSGAPLAYVKAACDFAFFYGYYAEKVRCIHIRGFSDIWTACGVPDRFISPNGNPLELIEIPTGEIANGWSILEDAFNNKIYDINEDETETTVIETDPPVVVPSSRRRRK